MAKRNYVNHKDYNGYKDIKFVMETDDFRLTNPAFSDDYEVIASVDVKNGKFSLNGQIFEVFSDSSVSPLK